MIFIAIANCIIFKDKAEYKSDHVILDKKTFEHDLQDFSFTFIELPKFKKDKISELQTIIEKWCYFFKYAANTIQEDAETLQNFVTNNDSSVIMKKIRCPNCSVNLRIPSDRRVKFTCPSCGKKYINNNYSDPISGKQKAYWTENLNSK